MHVCVLARHRREVDVLKEDNRRLRQEQSSGQKENDNLKREAEKLEKRVAQLLKYAEEYNSLHKTTNALRLQAESYQEQCESLLAEKEDLEHQNRATMEALNEERQVKSMLESKLSEESMQSPARFEKDSLVMVSPGGQQNHQNGEHLLSSTSPTPAGARLHSTPYKKLPNLLSELQSSFMSNVDMTEMESLRQRCKESDDSITALRQEKLSLEDKVSSLSLQQSEATSELDKIKDEYSRLLAEKEGVAERLKEDLLIKEENVGQLRNKLSTALAEKASMEIEVDGLKDELQRLRDSCGHEVEKVQKEYVQEQARSSELRGQVVVLEEQITLLSTTIDRLEAIIYSSNNEIASMADELRLLYKSVTRLGQEGRPPSRGFSPLGYREAVPKEAEEESLAAFEEPVEGPEDEIAYSLELKQGRAQVKVQSENHSLLGIAKLHGQLRAVRSPLENFTKIMLERSLAQSSKHLTIDSQASPDKLAPSSRRASIDLEVMVNKCKAKLAHKTEEVNNLRAIMKARATTADVAISSLRSKLEGQARAYQTELTRLKHQIKTLKKERDEHNSLRAMYAKRCEEYVDEMSKVRRELEKGKMDRDELMVCLKKTIQKKLDLSRELEEYRVEQERLHLIPKLLGSSRV